jgi:hypothetical protein
MQTNSWTELAKHRWWHPHSNPGCEQAARPMSQRRGSIASPAADDRIFDGDDALREFQRVHGLSPQADGGMSIYAAHRRPIMPSSSTYRQCRYLAPIVIDCKISDSD